MLKITLLILALLAAGPSLAPLHADGGYGQKESPLSPIHELIEDEKYQQAITRIDEALRDQPDSADLLNLLAYSNRKLGNFDVAMENYLKALEIDSDHRGANEYLGELFLQLGQPEKAEERLAVLDKECFFGCDEYDKLKRAIEDYRKQNPS
ncbi:MAG: tetratricopeptide repeat protein [Gammaproteobacteria bacterium]|nr:tetratricopeptide repeat protein [Gammaproteobacteria bacterium]